MLYEEKHAAFEAEHKAFVASLEESPKIVIITLMCVEESSEAFDRYCAAMPCTQGFDLVELRAGIAFDRGEMRTGIFTNCAGEHSGRNIRKEFLRMIRVAENYFKG